MNYYNEFDPFAASWLRELIKAGLIPAGDVDERSIKDVSGQDLRGYTQCHFFAGIGGWSLALQLAGWPVDRPVWTGSCPCQPFSAAGKGAGFNDDRHLWPDFQRLIAECAPSVVFGEQVASKATDVWFDLVQADLEALGYAFGVTPFPAAGVGAPHIRDRAYWVANRLVQPVSQGLEGHAGHGDGRGEPGRVCAQQAGPVTETGGAGRLADTDNTRRQLQQDAGPAGLFGKETVTQEQVQQSGADSAGVGARPGPLHGFWRAADWLQCRDGKWRPVEPGTFPLAHGVPNRVGRLRGYGNAIVPPQAAEFIGAFMEVA